MVGKYGGGVSFGLIKKDELGIEDCEWKAKGGRRKAQGGRRRAQDCE